MDLTTGDFLTTEVEAESALLTELERLRPAEIIYPAEADRVARSAAGDSNWIVSGYDDWTFAPETAVFTVREHFKVASLDGFGLKDRTAAIGAAGGALHYLDAKSAARRETPHAPLVLSTHAIFSRSITRRCGIWKSSNRCITTLRATPRSTAR